MFETGCDREDKASEAQVGELYRQIGQLKVENDFVSRRLGVAAMPLDRALGYVANELDFWVHA